MRQMTAQVWSGCCLIRVNFLVDAIGCNVEDVMQYPQYLLLSLADTIGPRYYFLARSARLEDFSDPSTGVLQLHRVLQPPLDAFLADIAEVGAQPVLWVCLQARHS